MVRRAHWDIRTTPPSTARVQGRALADTYIHNCNKLRSEDTRRYLRFRRFYVSYHVSSLIYLKLWDSCTCLTSSLPSFHLFLQFKIDSSNTPKKICAKLTRVTPESSGSRSCWLSSRCQQSCSATRGLEEGQATPPPMAPQYLLWRSVQTAGPRREPEAIPLTRRSKKTANDSLSWQQNKATRVDRGPHAPPGHAAVPEAGIATIKTLELSAHVHHL